MYYVGESCREAFMAEDSLHHLPSLFSTVLLNLGLSFLDDTDHNYFSNICIKMELNRPPLLALLHHESSCDLGSLILDLI